MNQNLTLIAFILDRSGSMSSIEAATVEGSNAFVAEQQNAPGEALFYFVQFDDVYENVFDGRIQDAPVLTLSKNPTEKQHRFEPRGNTALLDAIGMTIDDVGERLAAMPEAERPGKVVVTIMTDGHENHSRKFLRHQIADMIAHQRDVYQWQFQYLGANQDAIAVAAQYNISASNAISYAANTAATQNVMRAASSKLSHYRATGQSATMDFVEQERNAAMETDK
jgi:hypothetical protein